MGESIGKNGICILSISKWCLKEVESPAQSDKPGFWMESTTLLYIKLLSSGVPVQGKGMYYMKIPDSEGFTNQCWRAGGIAQLVESLPGLCQGLGSISGTEKHISYGDKQDT